MEIEWTSFKECAEELEVDLKGEIEEEKLKCLFKCSMEKEGIFKGGLVDMVAAEKSIREEEKIKEMNKGKAIASLPECIDKAKDGDDCQKAYDFAMCMMKFIEA